MDKKLLEQPDISMSFPTPLALVTCADENGKSNVLTLAWVGIVSSEPPMVSIAIRRGRLSHPIIKSTGEFVLNVPTESMVKDTDYVGSVSGENVDKWENSQLTPLPATRVKAPLIAECPVSLECVVRHTLNLGSHDAFLSEVVAMHVAPDAVTNGKLDGAKMRPLVYFAKDYFGLSESKLAERGVGLPKKG